MLYLKNISEAQVLFIPKGEQVAEGDLTLTLNGTISRELAATIVSDLHTSDLYFRVAIALPEDTPSGEYEYTLSDIKGVLSTGLLQVEHSSATIDEYENTITYEQYR